MVIGAGKVAPVIVLGQKKFYNKVLVKKLWYHEVLKVVLF